jgi:hypothetical protein
LESPITGFGHFQYLLPLVCQLNLQRGNTDIVSMKHQKESVCLTGFVDIEFEQVFFIVGFDIEFEQIFNWA